MDLLIPSSPCESTAIAAGALLFYLSGMYILASQISLSQFTLPISSPFSSSVAASTAASTSAATLEKKDGSLSIEWVEDITPPSTHARHTMLRRVSLCGGTSVAAAAPTHFCSRLRIPQPTHHSVWQAQLRGDERRAQQRRRHQASWISSLSSVLSSCSSTVHRNGLHFTCDADRKREVRQVLHDLISAVEHSAQDNRNAEETFEETENPDEVKEVKEATETEENSVKKRPSGRSFATTRKGGRKIKNEFGDGDDGDDDFFWVWVSARGSTTSSTTTNSAVASVERWF